MSIVKRPLVPRQGQHIPSAFLRQVTDALVQRISVTGGRANHIGGSIVLEFDKGQRGAIVKQFRFKTSRGDYIECKATHIQATLNETSIFTESGDTVRIAKPYLLRRVPFDEPEATSGNFSTFAIPRNSIGYKYTNNSERVATNSSDDTETQVIVPSYVTDDLIYAIATPAGGTGVVFATDAELEAGKKPIWIDLNLDARAWAKKSE